MAGRRANLALMLSLLGALLTGALYDAAKPFDRAAVISDLRLVQKRGGKSGDYRLGKSTIHEDAE